MYLDIYFHLQTEVINIASVSKSHMTTLCEMEFFNLLRLIWVHYLPLPSTKKDRPPQPPRVGSKFTQWQIYYKKSENKSTFPQIAIFEKT